LVDDGVAGGEEGFCESLFGDDAWGWVREGGVLVCWVEEDVYSCG